MEVIVSSTKQDRYYLNIQRETTCFGIHNCQERISHLCEYNLGPVEVLDLMRC